MCVPQLPKGQSQEMTAVEAAVAVAEVPLTPPAPEAHTAEVPDTFKPNISQTRVYVFCIHEFFIPVNAGF